MRTALVATGAILLSVVTPVSAHRLDEYLQATTISVDKDRVQAQLRLTPGIAVFPFVIAGIDTDADGVLSVTERRIYAESVWRDLSLTIDGDRLPLRLVSSKFAKFAEMKEGLGDIQLEFAADLPRGSADRRLVFENRHQSGISAYLVNLLAPRDPDIRVTTQIRNYEQSRYQLDYVQTNAHSGLPSLSWWSRGWLLIMTALLLSIPPILRWQRRARLRHDAITQQYPPSGR